MAEAVNTDDICAEIIAGTAQATRLDLLSEQVAQATPAEGAAAEGGKAAVTIVVSDETLTDEKGEDDKEARSRATFTREGRFTSQAE